MQSEVPRNYVVWYLECLDGGSLPVRTLSPAILTPHAIQTMGCEKPLSWMWHYARMTRLVQLNLAHHFFI